MRTTAEIRRLLEDAAKTSDRSLVQEVEFRLENSFREERLVTDALALAYGPELAGILLLLGDEMSKTGRSAGFFPLKGARNWWDNPYAYDQAAKAAAYVLEALRPEGEIVLPGPSGTLPSGLSMQTVREHYGTWSARGTLNDVASNDLREHDRVRRQLGEHLLNRIKNFMAANGNAEVDQHHES